MVTPWSIRRFVAEGWLATFDYYYSIRPDSEQQQAIDGIRKRGADGYYQTRVMSERLDVRPSIERLFETFERYAFDKKGIVYAIDIAHAEHIAEFYRSQGLFYISLCQIAELFDAAIAEERPPATDVLGALHVDIYDEQGLFGIGFGKDFALWACYKRMTPEGDAVGLS